MSFANLLSAYVALNLFVPVAFAVMAIASRCQLTAADELRLHYRSAMLVAVMLAVFVFLPGNSFLHPALRVWAAPSLHAFPTHYSESQSGFVRVESARAIPARDVEGAWALLAVVVLFGGMLRLFQDVQSLWRLNQNSFLIRKIGRVRILVHDSVSVPFSYRTWRQAVVVVPSRLVFNNAEFKMVVSHELQHHRQRDTTWQYLFWLLRLLCVCNPFVYFWIRKVSEVQEFACDEALAGRRFSSHTYARCLLEVAQHAIGHGRRPACATGMAFLIERNLLKRRIEKMKTSLSLRSHRSLQYAMVAVTAAMLAGTAYASKGLVQDRRISLAQAEEMAKTANADGTLPIVVNSHVVAQLNRLVGTPEGREFVRASLQRMEAYRPMILRKMQQYHAPEELLAVPLIESGYQNLNEKNNRSESAGLWQFIPNTARNYGLHVDENVKLRVDPTHDQRLDAEALTDAAMRYLTSNQLRFNDWQLAIVAYNIGENRTQEGIVKTGSHDAWELIREGYENDSEYLARFMAGLMILKNPSLVQ